MANEPYKILVADDDQDVLEHYRLIFGVDELGGELQDPELAILDDFLDELMKDSDLSEQDSSENPVSQWKVTLVSQGIDAVHAAQKADVECSPFTHALLDMRMPLGMDGLQTAIQLRAIDPEIQIIFVSAYFDYLEDDLRKALGERWEFLQKPFQKESILGLLVKAAGSPASE